MLKKRIMLAAVLVGIFYTLTAQENETANYMLEINSGYTIGIDVENSIPIEMKIGYVFNSFKNFGLTFEIGTLLPIEQSGMHFFIGPTFYAINTQRIRLPISIGFDFIGSKNTYMGFGGLLSFNYSISKNIYLGINAQINYYINNRHEEVVGIKEEDAAVGIDPNTGNKIYPMDNNGNPIYVKRTPIMENKDHFGNYFTIRPTIGIGFQF